MISCWDWTRLLNGQLHVPGVLHSDWLVWRHRGHWRRSLYLDTSFFLSLFLSLTESTGAVWLHFPSAQHCHRNVTHPCCCVRVRLISTTRFARRSLSRIVKSLYATPCECRAPLDFSSSPLDLDLCGTLMFVTVLADVSAAGNVRSPHLPWSTSTLLNHFCDVQFFSWKTRCLGEDILIIAARVWSVGK